MKTACDTKLNAPRSAGSSPSVSIVVCCYNSAARLPKTLEHLAALEIPCGFELETLIVDNASTDGTASTAVSVWDSLGSPHHLRVVYVRNPGLASARIKGAKEARHAIIVFCDDDNWLCPSYARVAWELLASKPHAALAGGRIEAVFESTSVPTWFSALAGAYAVGGAEGAWEVPLGTPIWGAGLVARKAAFDHLLASGFKFVCTDRRGAALSCGGDGELCHAVQWLGYGIYYDSRLRLEHWISKQRLTWDYVVRLSRGWGAATIANDAVRLFEKRHQRFRNAIRRSFLYHAIRGTLNLLPWLPQLLVLRCQEGNLHALTAGSKWGRLRTILALNFSYSKLVSDKARWLAYARALVPEASPERQ